MDDLTKQGYLLIARKIKNELKHYSPDLLNMLEIKEGVITVKGDDETQPANEVAAQMTHRDKVQAIAGDVEFKKL